MKGTTYIDERLLKYIPKKMQKYLVWLEKSCGVYFVTFEINGVEDSETCDTVDEIRWNCQQVKKIYNL